LVHPPLNYKLCSSTATFCLSCIKVNVILRSGSCTHRPAHARMIWLLKVAVTKVMGTMEVMCKSYGIDNIRDGNPSVEHRCFAQEEGLVFQELLWAGALSTHNRIRTIRKSWCLVCRKKRLQQRAMILWSNDFDTELRGLGITVCDGSLIFDMCLRAQVRHSLGEDFILWPRQILQ
jgi:hypothetical protein